MRLSLVLACAVTATRCDPPGDDHVHLDRVEEVVGFDLSGDVAAVEETLRSRGTCGWSRVACDDPALTMFLGQSPPTALEPGKRSTWRVFVDEDGVLGATGWHGDDDGCGGVADGWTAAPGSDAARSARLNRWTAACHPLSEQPTPVTASCDALDADTDALSDSDP